MHRPSHTLSFVPEILEPIQPSGSNIPYSSMPLFATISRPETIPVPVSTYSKIERVNKTYLTMNSDPFDDLLGLEDKFYDEGYQLGKTEGAKAGKIEGRVFGLEKGFEKYVEAGRLNGRSVVWAGRLPENNAPGGAQEGESSLASIPQSTSLPMLANPRLEKHIRVLYALSEPASLSTDNTEEAVSDFDDRLKRAHAKVKIIERLVGEDSSLLAGVGDSQVGGTGNADSSIEDVNILKARH